MACILLIDDDPYIRKALAEILESLGHSAATARDGREGLSTFRARDFDIVISDLRMPGMDGIELLTRIRSLDRSVGIVLITGHSTLETLVDATNRGVDAYITKPFKVDQIESVLDRIMSERQFKRVFEPGVRSKPGALRRILGRMLGRSSAVASRA